MQLTTPRHSLARSLALVCSLLLIVLLFAFCYLALTSLTAAPPFHLPHSALPVASPTP